MNKELENILNEEKLTIRALNFAIYAHDGQVRKLQTDIPYIMHPVNVANILRSTKFAEVDKHLIAAAYLHDIIEDTKYDYQFIEKYFGIQVAILVNSVTESDKSKAWEIRKQETLDKISSLNKKEKLLMLADKLSNIMDMNNYFSKYGIDFSKFKRGQEQQEWYYRNLYIELVKGEEPSMKLLRMFKDNINEVFGRSMEDYFNDEKDKRKMLEINDNNQKILKFSRQ